jgi:hypothetical protein
VAPYELETRAQLDFERHLGWTRRFERRWFRRRAGEPIGERLANAVKMGTGANMAFRREVFDQLGGFDPALGTGARARGGEDLDMFLRVLRAGHTLVYEPAALVRHRHRQDARALRQQLAGWASGMTAYLVRNMREHPSERRRLAGFLARLLTIYYPRRVAQSLVSRHLRLGLTGAEFAGAVAGLGRYRRGPDADVTNPRGRAALVGVETMPFTRRRIRTVALDLGEPLPPTLAGPSDVDLVRLAVYRTGRRIGEVDLWCGGRSVSRIRTADVIASIFWRCLLHPDEPVRRSLRQAYGVE